MHIKYMYRSIYRKYKEEYLKLKDGMNGGCKIYEYPQGTLDYEKHHKRIEYVGGKIYAFNNMDNDILNENSEFLIGSLTKLFTVLVIFKLEERGFLEVKNTIGTYYNDIRLANVKIIDIINHVSGMKNDSDKHRYEEGTNIQYTSATEVFDTMNDEDLLTKPIGTYFYSNVGYIFLGALIEKITGKNFKTVFKELILNPLNLTHTGFDETNMKLYGSNEELCEGNRANERTFACTAGQLKSSIADLIKFTEFPKLFAHHTMASFKDTRFIKTRATLSAEILKLLEDTENITDDEYIIVIHGGILCGKAKLYLEYNADWSLKRIQRIELKTVV
jgi:CubicO group peptidase (beta-lactamase class C family)